MRTFGAMIKYLDSVQTLHEELGDLQLLVVLGLSDSELSLSLGGRRSFNVKRFVKAGGCDQDK